MNKIKVNSKGALFFDGKEYKCVIGKNGVSVDKKEGDGATPIGCFPIRRVFYRADKVEKPVSPFETIVLTRDDGWCDGINDLKYNQLIKLPYPASHENLWREEDDLYDIIVDLGYNDNPPVPGKGSAIFMHIARPTFTPTAGCIALSLSDLMEVLKNCDLDTLVCVED
ncbi:MAG: L,D-transpeptidase family protein [bacterium]|nr:L,D-transpeptidase family protein [bacterium]